MSDDTTDTMPDLWGMYDLPFLREAARRIAGGDRGLTTSQVAQVLGLDKDVAHASAARLAESDYIAGAGSAWQGLMRITRITERGRRAVGLWPSPEVGYDRLLAKLDELIVTSTPEERTRLQRVRDVLVSGGGQVGVTLAGAVLGGAMGM